MIFKICVKPGFNSTALEEAGYDTKYGLFRYFLGRSKFNRSTYGWGGHTSSSEVKGGVKDVLRQVFPHKVETVLKALRFYTQTKEWIKLKFDHNLYTGRVNFPYNCFTLDLTSNSDVREKGIKALYLYLHYIPSVSIGIDILGASLFCNRNLESHIFYSSGDSIGLDHCVTGPKI